MQVAGVVSGRPSHESGGDSGVLSDDDELEAGSGGGVGLLRASMESAAGGGGVGRASLVHGSGARRLGLVCAPCLCLYFAICTAVLLSVP